MVLSCHALSTSQPWAGSGWAPTADPPVLRWKEAGGKHNSPHPLPLAVRWPKLLLADEVSRIGNNPTLLVFTTT